MIALLVTYLGSFEIVARMTSTSPLIPYEIGKYLTFLLLLYGIISSTNKYSPKGWVLLLLLLPSLFFDLSGMVNNYNMLVFNILGPINVCLAIIFFSNYRTNLVSFQHILRLLMYPLLAVLSFAYIKTPKYDDIAFSLGANFDTSGGFGSNQVSTAIGLGFFLLFVFRLNRWTFSSNRLLDGLLLFGFILQGLLTFSRGGMVGGVLGIILVLISLAKNRKKTEKTYSLRAVIKYAFIGLALVVATFLVVNNITGGLLKLRYQGETTGTLAGTREKTLNTLTSDRFDIFIGDLELWSDHLLLGVGVGASRFLRSQVNDLAAHIELSRLLAEHGVLGLLFFLILMSVFFSKKRDKKLPIVYAVQLALFFIAIYTTFHAAMRTFVTPLLIGVSLIYVTEYKLPMQKADIDSN